MGKATSVLYNGMSLIPQIEYNESENITKINRSNGIQDMLEYDVENQSLNITNYKILNGSRKKKSIKSIKSIKSMYLNESYEYDSKKNLKFKNNLINNDIESYSYDELDRLIKYSLNNEDLNLFEYDSIGNITKKTESSVSSYSYNSYRKQILESVAGNLYSFDSFGNLASTPTATFNFDWNNNLISLTKSGLTTGYKYDHEGIRVEKQNTLNHSIFLNKYTEVKNGTSIYSIYLEDDALAFIDNSGNLIHQHFDRLKSNVMRTNSNGNVVYSQSFYPFGSTRSLVGGLNSNNNQFTNQYKDSESDIYYFKKRYYSQEVGRFISSDSLYSEEINKRGFYSQDLNLYSYVRNNPLRYHDPDGQVVVLAAALVGAGLSAWGGGYLAIEARQYFTGESRPQDMANLNKGMAAYFGAASLVAGPSAVGAVVRGTSAAIPMLSTAYSNGTALVSSKAMTMGVTALQSSLVGGFGSAANKLADFAFTNPVALTNEISGGVNAVVFGGEGATDQIPNTITGGAAAFIKEAPVMLQNIIPLLGPLK